MPKKSGGPPRGRFTILDDAAEVHPSVELDDFTAIYGTARVGARSKILYGAKVYPGAVIGEDCIIGGDIPERCVVGDRVTYMGKMAHSHYDAAQDWDTTHEASATIEEGCMIGESALLIGPVRVGKGCYVAAGEVLRHDLLPFTVLLKGNIYPIQHFRGLIRARLDPEA